MSVHQESLVDTSGAAVAARVQPRFEPRAERPPRQASLAESRRRAVWSDGSEGEALRWYEDEILICEGDLIGKTRDQLRSLHFRRDREWLQS
jgi:hypothetical protein